MMDSQWASCSDLGIRLYHECMPRVKTLLLDLIENRADPTETLHDTVDP